MPRKRFITDNISVDDKVAEVAEADPVSGLMWPWFLVHLDDWGRITGSWREIRNTVFQSFPYGKEEIQTAIDLYEERHLAHFYTVGGKPYLQFNPKAFYELNSYIQKSRQRHDGSKLPPPIDHPWRNFWQTSDWDDTGQRKVLPTDDE